MQKDPRIFIEHILESIKLIEEYSKGKTKQDFLISTSFQDVLIRRLEIIGEAVKNLPQEIKDKYPDNPWKQIAGMRDKLIHQYFGIDIEFVWGVIEKNLPVLKENLIKIKKELNQ